MRSGRMTEESEDAEWVRAGFRLSVSGLADRSGPCDWAGSDVPGCGPSRGRPGASPDSGLDDVGSPLSWPLVIECFDLPVSLKADRGALTVMTAARTRASSTAIRCSNPRLLSADRFPSRRWTPRAPTMPAAGTSALSRTYERAPGRRLSRPGQKWTSCEAVAQVPDLELVAQAANAG